MIFLIILIMCIIIACYVWDMRYEPEKQNKSSEKLDYVPYKIFYNLEGDVIAYWFFELYDAIICKEEIQENVIFFVKELEYFYMKKDNQFIRLIIKNKEFGGIT